MRSYERNWLGALSMAVVLAGACTTGDEGDGVEGKTADYEGIYRVDRLTANQATCDVEGASTIAADRDHMVVFGSNFSFGPSIAAEGCADPADCRSLLATRRGNGGATVTFSFRVDKDKGDHLAGRFITTGFSDGGGVSCAAGTVTDIRLSRPADGLARIEARSVIVDHPADGEGVCSTEATERTAAGMPCGQLEVIEATRLERL